MKGLLRVQSRQDPQTQLTPKKQANPKIVLYDDAYMERLPTFTLKGQAPLPYTSLPPVFFQNYLEDKVPTRSIEY